MKLAFMSRCTYGNNDRCWIEEMYPTYEDAYNALFRSAGRHVIKYAVIEVYSEAKQPLVEVFYNKENIKKELEPFMVKPCCWLGDTWCVPEFLRDSCHESYMNMFK